MKVRYNLLANLFGSAWTGAATLVFVPVYLRHIGAEGYGLVGFYGTIATVATVFDAGFGGAAARELARSGHGPADAGGLRDLVRTLEWLFWGIALLLGAALAALAPFLATHWLNLDKLPTAEATSALRLMGLALLLQWPVSYYTGCLNGLQRQVALNAINSVMLTVKFGGAALALALLSGNVETFFAWHAGATLLHTATLRAALWRYVPAGERPRARLAALGSVRGFAFGIGSINALGLLLNQLDKLVLSVVLPLEQFGYYSLAASLAVVITRVVVPIFNATYPRLTQLVQAGNVEALRRFYHDACQLMALAVAPLALLVAVFGSEVLRFWTGNPNIAETLGEATALLAIGTLLNAYMTIPYALQLAHGWTRLAVGQNIVGVIVLVPLTIGLARQFGLVGAAALWPILNGGYVLISAQLLYRKLLPAERWPWYRDAVIVPTAVVGAALLLVHALAPDSATLGRAGLFVLLAVAGGLAQLAVLPALPFARELLARRLRARQQVSEDAA